MGRLFGGGVALCKMVKLGVSRLLRIGAEGICTGSVTVRASAQYCIDGKRARYLASSTRMVICLDTFIATGAGTVLYADLYARTENRKRVA